MNVEVQVALITAGLPLVGGAVAWFVKHLRTVTKVLATVQHQVANDHGTNLREDIDLIRDLVMEVRVDTAWTRREQLDQARRLTALEAR